MALPPQLRTGEPMTNNQTRVLLTILVAMTSLIIFFSTTVFSQELPIEEMTSTLEPIAFDKPALSKDPVKLYAQSLVIKQWGFKEWESFDTLVHKESSWNHKAQNQKSTATGLMQFLNATWDDVGCERTFDPKVQLDCGVEYIAQRYGTPSKALSFHLRNGWY